ncbi:MAG: hypothetical protein ACXAEF_11710, partial [Candidatus Thorarchaeota archaeon]
MQQSVAAVETLYQIDSLDTIQYRSNLETAILSEYSSGTWDTSGWTIRPFIETQSAVDWLSTRAALRLGIIDATMATEIASAIVSRIQYNDLWALSRDVATLALLNSSFSIDLNTIDSQQVLTALGTNPFSNGWYNSSYLWQPVYTAGVLEMISILGLRPHITDTEGSSLVASVSPSVSVGGNLDIFVSITSPVSIHSVYIFVFNEWTRFDDVASVDTLTIQVPNDYSVLGPHNASVMSWNYNSSRSFDLISTQVEGLLSGSLLVQTPTVLLGDKINGTVSWNLSSGGDAGTSQVIVRLSDVSYYEQWTYDVDSPLDFSIPTDSFGSGFHNLTVYINQSYCDVLILQEQVWITAPDLTYLSSPVLLAGDVGAPVNIPWSLHFNENDSFIPSQVVSLEIIDDTLHVVYSDSMISTSSASQFTWTPADRGNYTYNIQFERNGTLESCSSSGDIDVFEDTELTWQNPGVLDQYDTVLLTAYLSTQSGAPLAGYSVSVQVISPTSLVIYDSTLVTNSTGQISFYLLLSENGNYTLDAEFSGSGLLLGTSVSSNVVSWSTSTLTMGGIASDGLVNTTWDIWTTLYDSLGNPIVGESVDIQIVYLPSTTVYQTSLTTNSTGGGSFQWTASSPGSYQISVDFAGSASRQSAQESIVSNLRIPVILSFSGSSIYEVGTEGWSLVQALDHSGSGITGLSIMFVVRNPQDTIIFQTTGIVSSGLLNLSWTPTDRGQNNITISTSRTSLYESGYHTEYGDVYETPTISISLTGGSIAQSLDSIVITVLDSSSNPIDGILVDTLVVLNSMTILDVSNTSLMDGTISLSVPLSSPGSLEVTATISSQSWLYYSVEIDSFTVYGLTQITIDTNGLPVDQTSVVGYQALLLDWESLPIANADVTFSVEMSNGSVLLQAVRVTGADGTCAFAYTFNEVGDFVIIAEYTGEYLNASSTAQVVQRVTVTPNLVLNNSPSCLVGSSTDIQIGIMDALGQWMVGLNLHLVITMNGTIAYDSVIPSVSGTQSISWTPVERGIAIIELSYDGDLYVLANSVQSSLSALEQVNAALTVTPSSIDLGNSTNLIYELLDTSDLAGVNIQFEVLNVDLVPVWSTIVSTNNSGFATASFSAIDIIGVLTVLAAPVDPQMVGGDVQDQLIVMTGCSVTTSLEPAPASIVGPLNITVECRNDLGGLIDGLSVRISLFYQGSPIRLGVFSDWITKTTINGSAWVEFTPTFSGSYQVIVDSSGSIGVHSFYNEEYHIVHNPTSLEFVTIVTDLEVGEDLHVVALLTNFFGDPLVGRVVTLSIDTLAGPVDLVTNATGHVDWYAPVNQEGLWEVSAQFDGVGVYLPSSQSSSVDVRYGTRIFANRTNNETIIADTTQLTVAVLLEDTGGSPLEGRTILYQVYHDSQGLLYENSFVQIGQTAEIINISLDRLGDHTILFSFAGTVHYHPSSTALQVFVVGTSEISLDALSSVDRSVDVNVSIILLDELGFILDPASLQVDLYRDGVSVDINTRLVVVTTHIDLLLTGLEVGRYSLNVTLLSTSYRIGAFESQSFNVTAISSITISDSEVSGLVGQSHSLTLHVEDSLTESVEDAYVYVSIFDPDGTEIFGSLLTTRSLVVTTLGYAEIDWTPSKTGNYSIFIEFEGTEYLSYSNLTITVLTRYETH